MGTGAGVGVVRGVVGCGVDPGGDSTHSPLAMSLEREYNANYTTSTSTKDVHYTSNFQQNNVHINNRNTSRSSSKKRKHESARC